MLWRILVEDHVQKCRSFDWDNDDGETDWGMSYHLSQNKTFTKVYSETISISRLLRNMDFVWSYIITYPTWIIRRINSRSNNLSNIGSKLVCRWCNMRGLYTVQTMCFYPHKTVIVTAGTTSNGFLMRE